MVLIQPSSQISENQTSLIFPCHNRYVSGTIIRVLAPSKINLFLHITGKRPNGYHELESVMAFTHFGDEITFSKIEEESPKLTLEGSFASILSGDDIHDNLVLKAYDYVRNQYSITDDYALLLDKKIPVQAGIGGGSADAAAVIRGLTYLHHESKSLLLDTAHVADTLGADVPACMACETVMVRGIGERISKIPVSMSGMDILLVNTHDHISTKMLFEQLNQNYSDNTTYDFEHQEMERDEVIEIIKQCRNDLTQAAVKHAPNIQTALKLIEDQEGCYVSRMSGSGATCFGLFANSESAQSAKNEILKKHPEWWVVQTTFI
ncbi:MAG: 4-(cytidine 5'-diphospho)-2-C-methyl-D-erythritol kinase [Rickettsiales bacterium]|nr:4-(cytidine 5'-diphospho)-2-C-methyl-D-erythritol kinase [Rickettsiales bacterium]